MYISLLCILFVSYKVEGKINIMDDAIDYFKNGTVVSFADKWELYRAPIENAIETTLKETFHNPGLSVQGGNDAFNISDGFLVYDNNVHVLFKDMYLSRLPRLQNPRVVFSLASNVLRVEAGVSKMFLETNYQLFRNVSDVVYSNKDAASNTSPFTLQQVQDKGEATIIAEHCNLAGFELATLLGESVNLGQDNFRLNNCKFSVEISNPSLGSPPLIVPYFAGELGLKLEKIITKPLQAQLTAKLKDAVFSYVNTSSIFGIILPSVRNLQQNLFKKTTAYMTEVIKNLNKLTAKENAASEELDDMEITWTEEYNGKPQTSILTLTHMVISGLDTAYSAHTGGAYKFGSVKIDEAIRFSALQVRGSGSLKVNTEKQFFVFSSEVQDFICHVSLREKAERSRGRRKQARLELDTRGWRSFEIYGTDSKFLNSLISGVFFNRIPETITKHLHKYFGKAASKVGPQRVMTFNTPEKSDVNSGADYKLPEAEESNIENNIGNSEHGLDYVGNNDDTLYTDNESEEAKKPCDNTQREGENEEQEISGNVQDIESSHNIDFDPERPQTTFSSNEERSDSKEANDAESSNEGFNKPMFPNKIASSGEKGNEQDIDSSHDIESDQEIETPDKSQTNFLSNDEQSDPKPLEDAESSNEEFNKPMVPNKISSSSGQTDAKNEEYIESDCDQKQSGNGNDSNSKERRKFYNRRQSVQRRHTARISDNEIHSN